MKRNELFFFFIITAIVFFPLFLGYNFLPFERYPQYCKGTIEIVPDRFDYEYQNVVKNAFWFRTLEFSWFSISIPDDFYASNQFRKGKIPFWNPYNGCGYSTFGSGQFRPFNPFKIPFYLFPSLWSWAFSHFLLLIFGAFFFFNFLVLSSFSKWEAFLGTTVFSLNPWILDRFYQTDGTGYLVVPFILWLLSKFDYKEIMLPSFFIAFSFFLLCSVSHPTIFVMSYLFCFCYYFFKDKFVLNKLYIFALSSFLTTLATTIFWLPALINYWNSISYKNLFLAKYDLTVKSFFTPSADLFILPPLAAIFLLGLMRKRTLNFFKITIFICVIFLVSLPIFGTFFAELVQKKLLIHSFYFKPFFWVSFSIVVTSGLEEVFSSYLENAKKFVLILIMLLTFSFDVIIHYFTNSPSKAITLFPNILFGETALLVLLFSLFLFYEKMSIFRNAIVFLLILPLFFPLSFDSLCWNRATVKISEAAKWISENHPSERTMSIGFMPYYNIPPNWGSVAKIRQGELISVFFHPDFFKMFYNRNYPPTMIAYSYPEIKVFEQIGAKYLIVPKSAPLLKESEFENVKLVNSFNDSFVYMLEKGKGRIFFAEKAILRDESEKNISKQIVQIGGGKDGFVVVNSNPLTKNLPLNDISGEGQIKIIKDDEEEIQIEAKNEKNSLLVIRDVLNENWDLMVDGQKSQFIDVNGCFKGIYLFGGNHIVHLKYSPIIEIMSLIVSFSLVVLLLCFIVVEFLKGKNEK